MSLADPVIDSSPLIYLEKARKLHLLEDIYGSIKLLKSVYYEVRGEEKGFEEVRAIKAEISKSLFISFPLPASLM